MAQIEGEARDDIDVKRFYLPGIIIRETCGKCNSEMVKDMAREYFSYPKWGEPQDVFMYCRDCNTETKLKVKLSCKLEIV